MADPPSSPPASQQAEPPNQSAQPDLSSSTAATTTTTTTAPPPPLTPQLQQQQQQTSSSVPPVVNPNPNPNPNPALPPPILPYAPPPISGAALPPAAPSYRPVPQFSPLPGYQNSGVGVPPPGVAAAGAPPQPMMAYQVPHPGLRPYATPVPNGYPAAPPPGILRYPAPYTPMARPSFPQRPPGVLPVAPRPLVPIVPGVRPIVPPVVRPAVPSVTPAEKPQTTVYVGKIAPTVENDFMLSILQICGPVKSWKREQDPTYGTPKGFGFCEFESAEGVLRALRLLTKFNIDGQELLVNVSQATREYLERFVENKTQNSKNLKEAQAAGLDKEGGDVKEDATSHVAERNEASQSSAEDSTKDGESGNKENHELATFGIVTDEDKDGDQEALKKLTSVVEERLKSKPLPPPPPPPPAIVDGLGNSSSDLPPKSKYGDSGADVMRNDVVEDKNGDETPSDSKAANEQDRPETGSPDRTKRYDRRSRDRERDWEKEREIDRYEREAERERVRKERELRRKIEEAEREYEERLKDWEYREREKEKQRQYEKERDKERERKRRKEILYDEEEEDDDSRKRWRRSVVEDKRRKRLREKEDDLLDRLKEKDEIIEAKRRAEEEKMQQQELDAIKVSSSHAINESEERVLAEESSAQTKDKSVEEDYEHDRCHEDHTAAGNGVLQNGTNEESAITALAESEMRQSGNAPARKLGFGLVGSGKRAAVPSVFHEEDDDEAHKEKKMRPLVPIDYSTEELQAVQSVISGPQAPNLVAAAEFAKRISDVTPKEEKPDPDREKSRRSHDRLSHRERGRNDDDNNRGRDDNKDKIHEREKDREHGLDKVKTSDKQKLLDAKQLIDMIPKTKEELFSYEINWTVYDKHSLHERMKPWISKKIIEFLGEEVSSLVEYIVVQTQAHVKASDMLEQLQSILDDEAEMFVLKMWRMLIFEIKKVETGLALRSKT
ncbi:hypothetical protein Tsubulata_027693 [Turnera subulata]|uniref:RRM domain-containing protein n=1 Tax=Turnera subulata TaxID=218843 RepID=A0A9Q0FEP1_9ROSI|nr:hypothetical protein Tsubulata_027693 [Turnera subulata]